MRDAVPASLSAAQSVTAAAKSAEVHAEDNSNVRKIVLDAQSREVIHQALDTARRLVRQPPEETRQRLRAYVRGRAAAARKIQGWPRPRGLGFAPSWPSERSSC
ncbi:MAG: hypothetical protein WDO17_19390 [Alphaproteobacteria bacterium]